MRVVWPGDRVWDSEATENLVAKLERLSIQRKKNIHDKSFNKSKFSNSAIVSSNHLWLLQRHVITHYEGDQCRLGLPSAHPCAGALRPSAPPLCARPARQVLAGHFSVCTPGTERKRHEVSHQALLRSQQLWRLSSGKEKNITLKIIKIFWFDCIWASKIFLFLVYQLLVFCFPFQEEVMKGLSEDMNEVMFGRRQQRPRKRRKRRSWSAFVYIISRSEF